MKKNKLTTAVVAGIAGVAGMAGVSNAMHLNDKGVGEVLIYPYYTVANDLNTLISVVNTTENVKAVKVRFLEGDNSVEVLDFNLYLSPYDVWTAALYAGSSTEHVGESTGFLTTSDTSCVPALANPQEFLPFAIEINDPLSVAAGNTNLERAMHGHFEILDMGVVDAGTPLAVAATHVNGVPASCAAIDAAWASGGTWDVTNTTYMTADFGGLFGGASIVDVAEGFAVSYEAIAIQDFFSTGSVLHTNPGSLTPNLASGVLRSTVYLDGAALTTNWINGFEAVSALFMQDEIYNEYYVDAAVLGKTEWVITFPTKNFHVVSTPAIAPFTDTWDGVEACEEFHLTIWDREELTPAGAGTQVSPVRPGSASPEVCQEANVVQFLQAGAAIPTTSEVLGSTNLITVGNSFNEGWAKVTFAQSMPAPLTGEAGYEGLPVAGFAVQKATNTAAAAGVLAQYGVLFDHRGRVVSN